MTQATEPVDWQEVADIFEGLIELAESEYQSLISNATYIGETWYRIQKERHEEEMARYHQVLATIQAQIKPN